MGQTGASAGGGGGGGSNSGGGGGGGTTAQQQNAPPTGVQWWYAGSVMEAQNNIHQHQMQGQQHLSTQTSNQVGAVCLQQQDEKKNKLNFKKKKIYTLGVILSRTESIKLLLCPLKKNRVYFSCI